MLWHLCQINKSWCAVVGKNVAWNALKLELIIDYISTLLKCMPWRGGLFKHDLN